MMLTKQLQACPAVSAEQSATPWQTATHSGETITSLLPRAVLSWMMALATVRGVAKYISISRSTPSKLNSVTIWTREFTKAVIESFDAKMYAQLPFWPPTEISTFRPWLFQTSYSAWGKSAASMVTLPSTLELTKAKMMLLVFGFTSLVVDCPQQSPPKPQQKSESIGVVACTGLVFCHQLILAEKQATASKAIKVRIFINKIQIQINKKELVCLPSTLFFSVSPQEISQSELNPRFIQVQKGAEIVPICSFKNYVIIKIISILTSRFSNEKMRQTGNGLS